MKKLYQIAILLLLLNFNGFSQTISPVEANEYCPNTEYTFTIVLPNGSSNPSISAVGGSSITPNSVSISGLSVSFKGKFNDLNATQSFKVDYTNNGAKSYNPLFKKIKSLNINSSCSFISPNQSTITPAICQAVNIPISFSNIPWSNPSESLCFGSITTYEYKLPVGWKVGTTFTSTGNNWYAGGNNLTVSTNLLGGSGSSIAIRPTNNCGSGLLNNANPVYININRSNAPVLQMNGSSSLTLYCGDATAKTFAVTNPPTCVSSYEWITANKGWFDANGVLITTNLITTSPSITIYPSCNSTNPAKDIEVLMKSGTEVLSSKVTVTFSTAAPVLAITGASEFCTSASYTVPLSVPCGASIVWSIQPLQNHPNVATLSCTSCQTVTLTKVNSGTVLLRATVTFPNCNSTGIYEKYIGVGTPTFRGWYNSPTNAVQPMAPFFRNDVSNPVCYGQQITTSTDITANSSVVWDGTGNDPAQVTWYQQGNNLQFYFYNTFQTAVFRVRITNSCGITSLGYRFNSTDAVCTGGPLLRLSVSPNPTSNVMNISLTDRTSKAERKEIIEVRVVDKMGNVKQKWNYAKGSGIQSRQIDISNLPTDTYNIMAFDGNSWTVEKIIKQ
jgi:Secretion system C-terminal sorting domain